MSKRDLIFWRVLDLIKISITASCSGSSEGKESAYSAGNWGLIPGEGNGYSLQYSCLENSMDRGAWRAEVP